VYECVCVYICVMYIYECVNMCVCELRARDGVCRYVNVCMDETSGSRSQALWGGVHARV